ncbi:MAG: (Fe-S)-binding protein, partial [Deltaproteobacteria bacterium]|nr:(Fe-S)-binding protein [Deltaproteobacteria bacterium]
MSNAVIMSVLLAVALATFSAIMLPRLRLLWAARSDSRFDHWGRRLAGMLRFALFQGRMPRDPVAGFAHIFIFSGFVVVSVATITHFAHAFVPDWHFPGLGGAAGRVYLLIKDVFEVLVLAGVSYALWRRLRPKPSRVGRSWEGVFILLMIATLMITDFLVYGGELVVSNAPGLPYNPAGHLASLMLAPWGAETAHTVAVASWWIHCAAILLFLNFLPLGKHFHVITSFPKVFFRNLRPWGQVAKADLEGSESFGIRTTADLTWSMVLDTYSCTECGRCNVFCPTALTGKPLSHRQLNLDLKAALYEDKSALLSGDAKKKEELAPLVDGRISADTIWACTTCGACEQECPLFIENVPRIIQMRQNKVLMEGDIAPELARAYKGMENNQNPWGIGFDQRDKWAEGLDIPRLADLRGEPPLLYWIGCAGSFDDRNKKVTLAMVKILKAAGVPFAILGKEEACTGDPARRTGNEYLFQQLATTNVERLNKYKVKRVLTHCPHCLHTLRTEYPQFGGNYEVVHHSQLIDQLIASGKLELSREHKSSVAWHDSCYLGRYHNEYDAPRRAVSAVPGTTLVRLQPDGQHVVLSELTRELKPGE